MIGRFVWAIALATLLCACTNPKYLPQQDPAAPSKTANATLEWQTQPTEESYGEFLITFDQDIVGELLVVLFMPSMGHESFPRPQVERIGSRAFRVFNVFFSMTGQWEIRMSEKIGERTVDLVVIPYRL